MADKTALLIPGLDALFVTNKLKRWLELPFIQKRLAEASQILSRLTKQEENLYSFVQNNRRLHIVDFDRTLIVLTTFQVAIGEQFRPNHDYQLIQGCSHGDIARNVLAQVMSFQDAIEILWSFAYLRKKCPNGYTASVRSLDNSPLSSFQLTWLADQGASFSSWSLHHGTVGGEQSFIDKLSSLCQQVGLKIKPILSYPVHSQAMTPLLEEMMALKSNWNFQKPSVPLFSSLWLRYLSSGDEVFEEGVAGATSPVKWLETLRLLNQKYKINRFINVGPSNTLTNWLLESKEFNSLNVYESWDIINENSFIAT